MKSGSCVLWNPPKPSRHRTEIYVIFQFVANNKKVHKNGCTVIHNRFLKRENNDVRSLDTADESEERRTPKWKTNKKKEKKKRKKKKKY
ncbi:hypothetical protein POVWA2_032870 [Plasmodium ovale wallikeri]|uniref:Uncharacterized protein n=1 Tax=Plasmodium ovale wallikeri TaxID=864142 RepID=A0A1A8YZY1_PLAOA|nr:hypothetical protein POVWA1_033250 [Plasmodium ovale wallikeri]SBT37031.1 hypothetical protein POVWA2_032870 [Plasmodium ovale wallikeri]